MKTLKISKKSKKEMFYKSATLENDPSLYDKLTSEGYELFDDIHFNWFGVKKDKKSFVITIYNSKEKIYSKPIYFTLEDIEILLERHSFLFDN